MKKLLVVFVGIMLLAPAYLFASSILGFGAGVTLSYEQNLLQTIEDIREHNENFDIKYLAVGADLKFNVSIVNFDFTAFPRIDKTNEKFVMNGLASVGLGIGFTHLKLFAGIGWNWDYNITSDGFSFLNSGRALKEDLVDSPINIRVAADFVFNNFGVGFYVVAPTDLTLSGLQLSDIKSIKEFWENSKIGTTIFYKF